MVPTEFPRQSLFLEMLKNRYGRGKMEAGLHFPTKGLPSIVGDRVTDGTHRLNKKIYSSLQTQRYTLDEGVLSQKGISIKPRLNKLNFCRSRGGSEPSLQLVLELFHL